MKHTFPRWLRHISQSLLRPLALLSLALIAQACQQHETTVPIEGTWTMPIPEMGDMRFGFTLRPDGSAVVIGAATLVYESWSLSNNHLIINGLSIGNRQTCPFSDTMLIVKLTPDTLVLSRDFATNDILGTYTREKTEQ